MSCDYPGFSILLVDDEHNVCKSIQLTLKTAGISNVIFHNDSTTVIPLLKNRNVGVVLLDLMMPNKKGDELLMEIVREAPDIPVLIISGVNDLEMAVGCMKRGAFDYLLKPLDRERLVSTTQRAIEVYELRRENTLIKENMLNCQVPKNPAFSEIITDNEEMKALFKYTIAISVSLQPVLITGETGVGKELFAKAIHNLSGRKGEFVPVNMAGIDANAFSDTLFGHVKGAYTGAQNNRDGMVKKAAGGTLFLDEIGDLDLQSQVKLLRLLQEREYNPLGSDDIKPADIRVVAATNCNLKQLSTVGSFRKDLYYRLHMHQIEIPPLRKRLDDIKPLFDFFLEDAFRSLEKKKPAYPPEIISLLKNYNYPGNIRELRMMIYDVAATHNAKILSIKDFENYTGLTVFANAGETRRPADENIIYPEKLPSLEDANLSIIKEALTRAEGNQTLAAKLLGISQQTLNYRLKKKQIKQACL